MTSHPIRIKQTYEPSVDVVWKALTDITQMRRWFFKEMVQFEPTVGFSTEFDVDFEGKVYRHILTVTEVVPKKRLEFAWRYGGYPGESRVAWDLSKNNTGTDLTLTHAGFETLVLSEDSLATRRKDYETGWNHFVCDSLPSFLSSQ